MEEQHPVPQDITGFKFKLVGDMTLKQFGELAGGAILAYLFWASNWHPILRFPLAFFFGFLGVALAFLPIEERPLDVWIANFLRAIYRPTYYVWKKDSSGVAIASTVPPQVVGGPVATPAVTPVAMPAPVAATPKLEPPISPPPPPPPQPTVSITELEKVRAEKMAGLTAATKKAEQKLKETTPGYKAEHEAEIVTVDKLAQMREQASPSPNAPKTVTPVAPPWTVGATDQVRVVDRLVKPSPTISLTSIPNIINGSVTDQRGAPMEGVVLVVKDKSGNSVRALKTNRVGQFIASTPLENGTYYLEFEMANYEFSVYEIALTGGIIKPLAIKGKYLEPKQNGVS